MVIKALVVGDLAVNCYVCYDEGTKEAVVFDPGDRLDIITEFIESNSLIPKAIMLTHSHVDHIGAVLGLKDKYDIPVAAYEEENELLMDPKKNMSRMMRSGEIQFEADVLLKDSKTYNPFSTGEGFLVLHTPGHTRGGACYYSKDDGFVITGDTLFCNSIGRSDFYSGDFAALMMSIKQKLMPLNDNTVVYPGHGSKSSIGAEKANNPFIN